MDYRLELVLVPVTDVDRSKAFYERMGFNLDVDHQPNDDFRVVQFTPPGSSCSITFGKGITAAPPGSAIGMHLVVDDIEAAASELEGRGIEVGEIHHYGPEGRTAGVDPERTDYTSFAEIQDPDMNSFLLQEVRSRGASAGA